MKTIHFLRRITAVVMAVVFIISTLFLMPQNSYAKKKKTTFKLSKSTVTLTKEQDITLTSDKKKEKVKISITNPAAVSCASAYESYMKLSVSKGGTPMWPWTQLLGLGQTCK